MTSTLTFILAVSALACAVQGTYYYNSNFATNVIAAVKLALTRIALPTEDPTQLFQLFDSGKYNENNTGLVSKTLEILKKNYGYTDSQLNNIEYNETLYAIFQSRGICMVKNLDCTGQETSVYRTLDGSCNNLNHPEWGMAFRPQRRLLNPEYDDGVSKPRIRSVSGTGNLPNPRTVSNAVHSNKGLTTPLDNKISMHVFQWGQFLDHDIISTPVLTGVNGVDLSCCETNPLNVNTDTCATIYVPNGDGFFADGTCMNVARSVPALDGYCNTQSGPRQQLNKISSYIDGSNVYGSSAAELIKLRNPTSPEYMAVSDGNNLPPNNDTSACTLTVQGESCSIAGDSRVNVVPSLGSYHTLFVQEHNRIVNVLKGLGWTDPEELFQEARKINIAQIQHITYNEFLSWLLTRKVLLDNGLIITGARTSFFTGYDPTINTDISNDFGIAYRIGHTWIPSQMKLHTDFPETSDISDPDVKPIEDTYHNPHMLYMRGKTGASRMLKWMTESKCPRTDRLMEDGARNKLFLKNGVSFDLAALNINRGREHGIPPYWKYRRDLCGENIPDPSSWASLTWQDNVTLALLKSVYQSPMDIDLWTGIITEIPVLAVVGPTLNCIFLNQFRALRNGDRYWFERPEPEGFSLAKLTGIKQTSLSAVLCANVYDSSFLIPPNVFIPGDTKNDPVPCSQIPKLDLSPWSRSLKRNLNTKKADFENKMVHLLLEILKEGEAGDVMK
ncbi:hypothetical protein ACJMK2_014223 [Sinanodonta woodiana]|uniref:Peroxidase n=1 Tax=Sinanodonta woodiana TaxID=1069815 RepID=A0ABD3V001_SINWO